MPPSPELDVDALISVRQALDLLDAEAVTPRVLRLPLSKCRGYRLARDVVADRDYPPFDKALMDGYAVRAADVAKTPVDLPVVGVVPAGQKPERGIEAGEAMAVMTGAPLPAGAEAVVPVENTHEINDPEDIVGRVQIRKGVASGYAIARKASDVPVGQTVLSAGVLLEAPALAVAASVGGGRA